MLLKSWDFEPHLAFFLPNDWWYHGIHPHKNWRLARLAKTLFHNFIAIHYSLGFRNWNAWSLTHFFSPLFLVDDTVSIVLPRLSHLTAHIIIQANSMGLIPKTGEQHLIENNNINHNNTTTKQKKLKQPKQYNRL